MQERVFLKVSWAEGRPVEVIEDYPTWKDDKEVWTVANEMRGGVLVPNSHDTEYSITWLEETSARKLGSTISARRRTVNDARPLPARPPD